MARRPSSTLDASAWLSISGMSSDTGMDVSADCNVEPPISSAIMSIPTLRSVWSPIDALEWRWSARSFSVHILSDLRSRLLLLLALRIIDGYSVGLCFALDRLMLVFALIAIDLLFLLGKPSTTCSAATITCTRYLLADSGKGLCGPSCCNASAAVLAEQLVVQVLTGVKVIVKVEAQ